MPITSGFNHVATMTTDLDRLVAFYRDVFGAELTFEMEAEGDHPRMAILDLGGGAALNAFEVAEGQIVGEQRRIGHRGAIDHFALAVDSRATQPDQADESNDENGQLNLTKRHDGPRLSLEETASANATVNIHQLPPFASVVPCALRARTCHSYAWLALGSVTSAAGVTTVIQVLSHALLRVASTQNS